MVFTTGGVNASGLDNVTCDNHTFTDLQTKIDACENNSEMNLSGHYKYNNTDNETGVIISKNIKITGNDCIINGANSARCINITSNTRVILENITFINGHSNLSDGGGIHVGDNVSLTLINCIFKNNSIYNHNGGALSSCENCNIEIISCLFENNTSVRESDLPWASYKEGMGSALYHHINSTVTLIDSIFKSNNAYLSTILLVSYDDIIIKPSRLYVKNSTFENNTSYRCGVLYIDEFGSGEIIDCLFTDNHSNASTGTLILDTCTYSLVKNCKFISNSGVNGAGICIERITKNYISNAEIIDCEFKNNTATQNGGAISSIGGNVSMHNCKFENNTALENGGTIFFKYGALNLKNCEFIANSAVKGGSIYLNANNSNIKNSKFIRNYGNDKGGCIYLKEYAFLDNCSFSKNYAVKDKNAYGTYYAFNIKGKIVTSNIKTSYNSGKKLKIKLTKSGKYIIGVKLKIKINGKKYYRTTNTKGEISFKIPKLRAGTYKSTITSKDKSVNATKTIKIKITKAKAKVKISKKSKITITSKKTGKTLSKVKAKIKINGKTIIKKTNKKGQIKLKLKKGKNDVKITSSDANYSFSKKIKIKI